MNSILINEVGAFGINNPLVPYIGVDKAGLVWGFSDVPKVVGNTWDGIGKSMLGAVQLDTEEWSVWVWSKDKVKVVNIATLTPSGRMFSWDDVPEYQVAKVFQNKINNAKDRNIRFTYSFAQFAELLGAKTCCISGKVLEHKANGNDNSTQFSIDRLDPMVGYEPGNCVVMSGTLNVAKSNIDKFLMDKTLTDEERLKLIYKVENVLRKRIKKKATAEEAAAQKKRDSQEAFGAKFGILPPTLRG